MRWWDGSQWTEHVKAARADAPGGSAIDSPADRETPGKALLAGLGVVAFFGGGIVLIAVVVTLAFHPGSGSSESAQGHAGSAGNPASAVSGAGGAECERKMEALDKTAEILEDEGEIPSGERAPSDVLGRTLG